MDNDSSCKIITQGPIVIITISGKISKSFYEKLEKCKSDVSELQSQKVIFYFKDVTSIEISMHRSLVLIQHELRQRGNKLFIVGLNNILKMDLADKGVIRSNEVRNNLKDLLQEIS